MMTIPERVTMSPTMLIAPVEKVSEGLDVVRDSRHEPPGPGWRLRWDAGLHGLSFMGRYRQVARHPLAEDLGRRIV